jgi:Uncharacterized protein conserved in bacteria (DUF2272)
MINGATYGVTGNLITTSIMKPNDEELQSKIEQSRIEMEDHWRRRWVKVMEGELSLKEKEVSKPTPIWTTTPGVAVIGAVITLVTGFVTNFVQNQSALTAKRQELQSDLIQKAIERAPDHKAAALNLNFLWQAGLIPDYIKIPEFVEKSGLLSNESTGLPSKQTFGAHLSLVPPDEIPNYDLRVPKSAVSKMAQKVLAIAVAEINKNIHESASHDAVQKYWAGLGLQEDVLQENLPWNGAFISWVLSEAGNPGELKKSAMGMEIWNSAVAKVMTFQMGEKTPQPGDLIFFSLMNNATSEMRAGRGTGSSSSGIVYEVSENEMSVISGNSNNAVRLKKHPLSELKSDPRLIGFVRLPDQ